MSILINGMEMPKNCAVCRLERDLFGRAVCFGYGDGRALMQGDLPPVGSEERRPSWCPLIPVPPHGDLIARDALYTELTKRKSYGELSAKSALRAVANAPTIIPASGKDTDVPTREEEV